MKRAVVLLATALLLATLGSAVWFCYRWTDKGPEPAKLLRKKEYSRLIAEGLRYRDYRHPGFDRFTFKRCHVEKRRSGALTFGGFNVLVMDGLVLNIPLDAPALAKTGSEASAEKGDWIKDGFTEALQQSQGLAIGHVSGVRINGLTVNRCGSNRTERVFEAERADSGMRQKELKLRGCVVYTPDGSVVRPHDARLVLAPDPTLIYRVGRDERQVGL